MNLLTSLCRGLRRGLSAFPAPRWAQQLPRGPSRWPESQGTAAIFRAVLQWRGVPWLGAAGRRLLARGLTYAEVPAWEKSTFAVWLAGAGYRGAPSSVGSVMGLWG